MTALKEFLFPAPARRRVGPIVRWWESRRLAYNVIVGTAGVTSIGATLLLHLLPPGGEWLGLPPWQGILIFGGLANVCYLLGPTVEVLIEKLSRGQILPTGPALFRMGLTFSLGLVSLPALMSVFFWILRILGIAG